MARIPRENCFPTFGSLGSGLCAAIHHATGARSPDLHPVQYGLVHRAVALGWPEKRVLVIDDDLGQSGTSVEGRQGFQRLVAEVGLDHVGLVLGMDMSRLARS